jgi:phosphatidylethanolamine-binding protein (PEBP) family uncharacterized protein
MRTFRALLFACALIVGSAHPAVAATPLTSFTADVWADNWFALYVNGVKVAEDPVPITTTKSFNKVSVTFKAKYPLTIAIQAKDYTENQTGLEYIGTPQQQIGDGGLIAQIHEATSGKLVAGTDSNWKSLVTFKAPLDESCAKSLQPTIDCKSMVVQPPAKWNSTTYSDSKWPKASEYTQAEVGVKDGYNEVTWEPRAKLIWSGSLTLDNTVLFRTVAKKALPNVASLSLQSPEVGSANALKPQNTCDGAGVMPALTWTNVPDSAQSLLLTMDTAPGPARPNEPVQTDFNHLVQYNISPKSKGLDAALSVGTKGKNFKGSLGYTPPCSQGPGQKTYTFHLYALSTQLVGDGLTGSQAMLQASRFIVAEASLNLVYTRQ